MRTDTLSPRTIAIIAGLGIAAVAAGLGYGVAVLRTPAETAATATGRPVLYWYDPMFPAQQFDRPGKSPFMDMQLVPRYAGEENAQPGIRIDPQLTQNLGVRLVAVERGALTQSIDVAGVIAFNERDVAIVQARSAGFVERAYRNAPGDVVNAGAPLADLYVSEWAGAQSEFLALLGTGNQTLIDAGRQRLRLLGMPADLIALVERSGQAHPVVTITTPLGGAIRSLNVRAGMTVSAGDTLAEVNGLATVWLNASVPESQAGLMRTGQNARAELAAYPGETFAGRVAAVLPEAQSESRTLTVRIELPNQDQRVRPGMFATVHIVPDEQRTSLLVPSEAVIRTGRRNLVMVALPNGQYQPAEVVAGREAGGQVEILRGLREGERVVASGQFLIDSEASLLGTPVRPLDGTQAAAAQNQQAQLHEGRGRIEALSANAVSLAHAPVPSVPWPAMSMNFRLANPVLANGLRVGDEVGFAFEITPAGAVVHRMSKPAGAP